MEGIPGAGKSTLAAGEDAGTLSPAENRAHLERIVAMLEWMRDAVRSGFGPPCFVLIDSLHRTHTLRPGVVNWSEAREFDARLAALGVKLALLHVRAETVWERLIVGREQSQFLRTYCRKFGAADAEIRAHFVGEGERFVELFEHSEMSKIGLAGDGNATQVTARAGIFWRSAPER